MSDQASAVHGSDRGFAKLDLELNDYPGPLKTSLFGIQQLTIGLDHIALVLIRQTTCG